MLCSYLGQSGNKRICAEVTMCISYQACYRNLWPRNVSIRLEVLASGWRREYRISSDSGFANHLIKK